MIAWNLPVLKYLILRHSILACNSKQVHGVSLHTVNQDLFVEVDFADMLAALLLEFDD